MFQDLTPYPGADAGGTPQGWTRRRIKTLLTEIDRRTETGEETLLSLRAKAGLVDHVAMGGKPIDASALVGYKLVRPGELVMNRMRAAIGVFGLAEQDGLVSPDYALFQIGADIEPAYLLALLRTPMMAEQMRLRSRGMGTGESGFLRLYWDAFGAMPVVLPPLNEQQSIVTYLAHAHQRISRAIKYKQVLASHLSEQRQVMINHAVVRGVDSDARLVSSGDRYVGQVPAHWETRRFSRVAEPVQRTGFATENLLSVYLGRGVIPYDEGAKRVHAPSIDLSAYQLVEPGDLVMNNQQAWRGSVGVSGLRGIVSPAYLVATLCESMETSYAGYLFAARPMVDQYVVASKGVGDIQRSVYWPFLRNALVPVPPVAEQRAIAHHLDRALSKTDSALAKVSREIELLEEFRTRLTADVVTGHSDVRGIAATLAPIDLTEVLIEVDGADGSDDYEVALDNGLEDE